MCLTAFCCRPKRRSSPSNLKSSPNPIERTEALANPQPSGSSFHASGSQELEDSLPSGSEQKVRMSLCSLSGQSSNIVSNHDFSNGLESWHSNCCQSYVASENSNFVNGVKPLSGSNYAVVTQRTENWQGLEQDITDKVTVGVKYIVTVFVSVHGDFHGATGVQATLRLENLDASVSYVFIERILASQDCWKKLEGSFLLTSNPRRVVFYLEGPNPGVDLLIDSVAIACEKVGMTGSLAGQSTNIVSNHDFSNGLESWHPNCCQAYVTSGNSNFLNGVKPLSGDNYAVVMRRSENWQGLEQDITDKVTVGLKYNVTVFIAVHGDFHGTTGVQATLRLEKDSSFSYVFIERILVSQDCWKKLEGSFSLTSKPRRVIFYLEGPDPGIDILIDSVTIVCEEVITYRVSSNDGDTSSNDEHIVHNPQFEDGLNNWSGRGCKITLCSSLCNGKILPVKGKFFVAATERSHNWNGIEQEITGRFVRKRTYEVTALVQIFGHTNNADVRLTLWVQSPNGREQYIGIAKTQASDKEWVQLQGKFLLNGVASKAILFIEGPNPGIDILVDSIVVRRPIKAGSSVPPITEVGITLHKQ
ncbi:endo-1,4-beta-xylanase 2-like isoform X2 [Curcuma longa]|uniref:endo-1,4-beta-xylanase 2-like isoform X2 n=1 Tax=Curcuma longa TaxID=136217 RepID=UPI003D9EBCB8